MLHEFQRQRSFLTALLVVALLGIAMPAGASGGAGGAGGEGGGGAGGGGEGGGEHIGVAQEADSGCCCTAPVSGPSACYDTSAGICKPYYYYSNGVCFPTDTSTSTGVGGCSVSGGRSASSGVDVVEVFGILLALACGAMHRRSTWRSGPRRSRPGARF